MAAQGYTESAGIPLPAFASSDQEAAERFERTRSADPFPDIVPALLNTADLVEYIAATGMLHPFDVKSEDATHMLKPASCGLRIGGTVVYWKDTENEGHEKIVRDLEHGEQLKLARNSIVYVTLEPMLRLPDYIAARFNLTIRDIYRGMLAGTGPLVDPGFVGQISIPLHNLTCNNYVITGGEPIAWMEFTKLSPNARWCEMAPNSRKSVYVPFPQRKRYRRTVDDYLKYASSDPITSSIPPLVESVERSARRARIDAEQQLASFRQVSGLAFLAVVLTLAAILIGVFTLIDDSDASRDTLTKQVATLESEVKTLRAAGDGKGP